jgi:hypothetical protein
MSESKLLQFVESNHQEEYSKKGFVISSLLDSDEIKNLEGIFHHHFNIDELPSVYDTVATTPAETIRKVDDEIIKICLPKLQNVIKDFHWVGSIFFIKKSDPESQRGMHIDPSMTDEGFNHIGVWIPLCDIDENNGRICLLSGSEKWLPPFSTPSMPYAYKDVEHLLEPKLSCLDMKAGEALFFNNSMLHCTQKNNSGKTRLAVIIKLIDKDAPLSTVYYNPEAPENEKVSLYQHSYNFFVDALFRSSTPPANSKFIKFIPNLPRIFKKEEILKLSI